MKTRFPAFRLIRTRPKRRRKRKVIQLPNPVVIAPNFYDKSLFPINIDPAIQEEPISRIMIPSILHSKFKQNGITHLKQLQGLDASTFLSWRGFGSVCFTALCIFLESLRAGQLEILHERIIKLHKAEFVPPFSLNQLSPDTLKFPIEKLNLPIILKTHIKTSNKLCQREVVINTVFDFITAFESGKLGSTWIGQRVRQIYEQIDTLQKIGPQAYLENETLDNQTFLCIVSLSREKLDSREQLIFDHRFVPINKGFLTLEAIARQLDLTRERVRQLDNAIVNKFKSGNLREFGWAIRRNALKVFTKPEDEFTFEQFLSHSFFRGCTAIDSKLPAPILFLDRVFYATFIITKNTILLSNNAKRNFT